MDGIKTFTNKEFGTVRTIVKDGEPWFVGKDVAEILGIQRQEMPLQGTLMMMIKMTPHFR